MAQRLNKRKFILTLFFCLLMVSSYAFEQTVQTNNICSSGSRYASNVTEVYAASPYQEENPYVGLNNAPQGPRRLPDLNDPYPTPVGEPPFMFLLCLSVAYVIYIGHKEKEKSRN